MIAEKTVGEKIKQIREMKKVSIEELAVRSGMELAMIQKIEQEKNIPSLAPLVKIARALGFVWVLFSTTAIRTGQWLFVRANIKKEPGLLHKPATRASI